MGYLWDIFKRLIYVLIHQKNNLYFNMISINFQNLLFYNQVLKESMDILLPKVVFECYRTFLRKSQHIIC